MKLNVELMPESCFGQSLRKRMKPYRWTKLRKQVIAEQGDQCAICNATGRLQCHELWEYDDVRHVQRLTGFRMLCSMCHGVEHYGMTNMLAAQGSVLLKDYIDHFCRVNGLGEDDFDAHLREARAIHAERCKHAWRTDLGEWEHLAEREPSPVRKRNTDLDGALQLQGSKVTSIRALSEGSLELEVYGITHHPPAVVYGYPRISPSWSFVKLTLSSCAPPAPLELPAEITSAWVSLGDSASPLMPLPLNFVGPVEVQLDLLPGGSVRLRATAVTLDRTL